MNEILQNFDFILKLEAWKKNLFLPNLTSLVALILSVAIWHLDTVSVFNWRKGYLVTIGSAAWLGPHRPSKPLPLNPVRPWGLLQWTTHKCANPITYLQCVSSWNLSWLSESNANATEASGNSHQLWAARPALHMKVTLEAFHFPPLPSQTNQWIQFTVLVQSLLSSQLDFYVFWILYFACHLSII